MTKLSILVSQIIDTFRNACDEKAFYPTALVVWGLIKYDHYKLNNFWQDKSTLLDIKESLTKVDLELIDLSVVGKVRASQAAYEYFGISRFFPSNL